MFGEEINYFLLELLLFPSAGAVVVCGSTIMINDLVIDTLIQYLHNEILDIETKIRALHIQVNALNVQNKADWDAWLAQVLPHCNVHSTNFERGFQHNAIGGVAVEEGPIIFRDAFTNALYFPEHGALQAKITAISTEVQRLEDLRREYYDTIDSLKRTKDYYHSPKSYLLLLIFGAAITLLIVLRVNGKI